MVFTVSISATISHSIYRVCPTWYQLNSVGKCQCSSQLGIIRCETNGRVANVILYDSIRKVIAVGTCPFSYRDNTCNYHMM